MNAISIYDTNVLVQVIANLKTAQTFFLDGFFGNIIESDTQYVSIDVDVGKRRMSPFVSPLVEGKLVEQRRIQTNVFEPPYVKDKRAPDLMRPVRRMLGERIGGGPMSAAERMEANLMFELNDQIDMLKRRQEWMAAQALLTGKVTVSGDGFPTSTIDFMRDPSLTIVRSGASMWDAPNSTASPTDDVTAWSAAMLKASGANLTDLSSRTALTMRCSKTRRSRPPFSTLPSGRMTTPISSSAPRWRRVLSSRVTGARSASGFITTGMSTKTTRNSR